MDGRKDVRVSGFPRPSLNFAKDWSLLPAKLWRPPLTPPGDADDDDDVSGGSDVASPPGDGEPAAVAGGRIALVLHRRWCGISSKPLRAWATPP